LARQREGDVLDLGAESVARHRAAGQGGKWGHALLADLGGDGALAAVRGQVQGRDRDLGLALATPCLEAAGDPNRAGAVDWIDRPSGDGKVEAAGLQL